MQNAIRILDAVEEPGRPTHYTHYAVLAFILLWGLYMFVLAGNLQELQLIASTITILGYILWGIIHHEMERTLNWKIIAEFFTFGLFLFSIIAVLLRM